VVDYGSRLVESQRFLSTRFRDIADLITEASYWAGQAGRDVVTAADVQQAIDEKRLRSNRIEERLRDEFARGALLLSVKGERVGQVNGISVALLGNTMFGIPNRITARIFIGRGGIIDIEREARLGGNIHTKAVLILSSFLSGRYARQLPLSLHASLVFEQSYGEVEGDSASLAELCVLISAIADLPLRQDLALTGSVNQHGEVQAVGGINEKIEGFFDTCVALGGLTGTQGVILPVANVENLMLREDVAQAVREGRFHLYAVRTVDEALELMTGLPAGEPDAKGEYPPDSVNGRVMASLRAMYERWQELTRGGKEEEEEEEAAPTEEEEEPRPEPEEPSFPPEEGPSPPDEDPTPPEEE
ncbi:MAG: S16 family serine protease, partial [Anaerolineae bacterium]|nr:AAA family ATPase [Caldilineales bacterium]MDW8267678.1 S16 family serine protease [Anaerolineae bacterium]